MKWQIIFLVVFALFLSGIFYFASAEQNNGKSFQVDSIFLKTAIKTNGSFDSKIRVMNLEKTKQEFEIKISDLEGLIFLSSRSFALQADETKEINVVFSNSQGKPEGIYVGNFEVANSKKKIIIPVILEIESDEILFDSNLALFPSGDIKPGEQISAEIKIFDLGKIGSTGVEINYFIKSFEGETIVSESENLAVKDQVLITKYFTLPENIKEGDYVFGLAINHKNSIGTSSRFFRVAESKFEFSLLNSTFVYAIVILLGFVFLILVLVFYSFYSRDRLLEELKKQYRQELKRQETYLRRREEENEKLLKTEIERNLNRRMFKKVKEKRKKVLEKIHKEREKELKKIKKIKKGNWKQKISGQIEKWKKQGYHTELFEEKIKVPSVDDIRKKANMWKKKGYDIGVLESNLKIKKIPKILLYL